MSKAVRLPDYLAAEVQKLADQEKRSLANMVKVLLEHAIHKRQFEHTQLEEHSLAETSARPRDISTHTTERTAVDSLDREVMPDFKPERKR